MDANEGARSREKSRGPRSRVGQTLGGKWKVEALLGAGGTGTVYAAVHRNGRRAAIKVLHEPLCMHQRVLRRFLSEGYVANKIAHPGAVAILDDGKDTDGTPFLVMELLRGQSLAQRIEQNGPLPEREVALVAIAVLDVLAAAHDAHILHRDIKPSNVFQTETGVVKVLDFGAARLRDDEDFITQSETTLGTPAFMAPELAAGRVEEVDARTDLWAVGATMFQLLTGRTVHRAKTANEALVTAATQSVPKLASGGVEVTPAFAAIVDRALAFQMSERWPNARAMQAALLSIHGPCEGYPSTSAPAGDQRLGALSSRKRLGAVLTTVMMLAALLVYALHKPKALGAPAPGAALSLAATPSVEPAPTPSSIPVESSPPRGLDPAHGAIPELHRPAKKRKQKDEPSLPLAEDSAFDGLLDRRK